MGVAVDRDSPNINEASEKVQSVWSCSYRRLPDAWKGPISKLTTRSVALNWKSMTEICTVEPYHD